MHRVLILFAALQFFLFSAPIIAPAGAIAATGNYTDANLPIDNREGPLFRGECIHAAHHFSFAVPQADPR